MTDNITVNIDATEPEIAATLSELRYLVFEGQKGEKGDPGADGHSPFINQNGYWVFWNYQTNTWRVTNLKAEGTPGADGVSPTVQVTNIPGGNRVTITDKNGPKEFEVDDGISPSVLVADIEGGHRVTITDTDGAHTFDVMDGEGGSGGGTTANAVLYTPMSLTPAQQEQARGNIGAAGAGEGGGMTEAFKQALLDCFENVAWINDQGQTYYDALYAALYPPKTLVSISAVFTQGSAVVYDTDSLDTLKQYLVVTATYDDSSMGVVTDYTLSGTLTVGTSTITVSYGGKTTTFNVTVSERQHLTGYTTVGNPTIDSNYRMTTSDGNFIKTPFNFDNGGKSWELRGKVNVSDANHPTGVLQWYDVANFVNSNSQSVRGLLVELNRSTDSDGFINKLNLFASSAESSWNIISPQKESFAITSLINGDVYFKAGWTGSTYYIAASADGVTWSNELLHEWKSATPIMTGYPIAFGNKRNSAWGYCIYVDSLELDIDGALYWKAVG